MNKKLIINASNIKSFGGLILLKEIILNLNHKYETVLLLNINSKPQLNDVECPKNTYFFSSSLAGRFKCELFLKKISHSQDKVLCFGNLPPLFNLPSTVFVFFHNVTMLKNISKFGLYFFLSSKKFNFIVQSNSVKKMLSSSYLNNNNKIYILPFYKSINRSKYANNKSDRSNCTFIYPANGELHKNHTNLIKAWINLSKEKIFPKLVLTICDKKNLNLLDKINHSIEKYNIDIVNIGEVPHSNLLKELASSSALVYPSLNESFGIPLIEARLLNIPIISSELDYVRDLVSPVQSFDPNSPLSISRAVKRFLNIEKPTQKVGSPKEFIEFILSS